MENQLRIAFVGRSRTANTYLSRYLYYKHKFRYLGMDDEMEAFIRKMQNAPSKRKKMLRYETRLAFYDAWQAIDPTIWAKRVVQLASYKETYNVVVPDCRYLEEVKVLEEAGFVFIRVHNTPKYVRILKTANKSALAYYEWFARDADVYVKARYSVNITMSDLKSREAARKSVDRIYTELTAEISSPKIDVNTNLGDEKDGKEEISALDANHD